MADDIGSDLRLGLSGISTSTGAIVEALPRISASHSWRTPDANGKSLPRFVNRQKMVWDTSIDIAYLQQTQRAVAELACEVVTTVTHMGWQFPGSRGPGKTVFEKSA
jgi:hypothetical protein